MADISVLQLLYIVLIVFGVIIGTLLSIILWKLNKIMRIFNDVTKSYDNVKSMAMNYSSVPQEIGKKFF